MDGSVMSQLCGWVGAGALLLAYVLVSSGRIGGKSAGFNGINIIGGALLSYGSWVRAAWPSVTLNLIWIVIGVKAIGSSRTRTTPDRPQDIHSSSVDRSTDRLA
jgi:hypothetical protein